MCFLFPLGAVLMRGNAGALTERHNEVRSTGKATVIRDGLDALRGGEQLLLCGAQTHGLQKLMRCNGLVFLKLTHIVAGAERSALRQVLDGKRLIRVIVRHIVGRVLNGDLEIAFFLFPEHKHEQNEQLVDRQGNNMRIGLVLVHRDHDAADTFLNLGIASGGQDEPMRIENKMCIGRAAAACKVEPAHADRCEGVIAVRFSAVKQNQAAGTGSACFTAVGDRQFAFIYNKHLADIKVIALHTVCFVAMVAACVRNMVQVRRGKGICIVVIAYRICQNTHIIKHNWCQLLFVPYHDIKMLSFAFLIQLYQKMILMKSIIF